MIVKIPESIEDINLKQFQRYNDILPMRGDNLNEFEKIKIEIFTNLSVEDINNMPFKDFRQVLDMIDTALSKTVEFKPIFQLEDVEFGFIPNLDKITLGEFRDLSNYGTDIKDMHRMMAVLFRPILEKDLVGNYSVIPYEGTDRYAKIMQYMPLSIVNGALVFFSSLANELLDYTQKFTEQEQPRGAIL